MAEDTRRRILVAQESSPDREFTARFLETLGGYKVFQASNGMGLIKSLKERPDIILLDTARKGQPSPSIPRHTS